MKSSGGGGGGAGDFTAGGGGGGAAPEPQAPAATEAAPAATAPAMKRALRREVGAVLKGLAQERLEAASAQLAESVRRIPRAQEARRVSVYLAMKNEAQTQALLEWLYEAEKRVFVPKVVGPGSEDMRMPELASMGELAGLEKTKWGIPEFTVDQLKDRPDGVDSSKEDLIDVVLTPGVAFTTQGYRLGHGRGYYDAFLKKLQRARKEAGLPPAYTVGISLDEQIVESVPVEDHDVALDAIATPSAVYYRDQAEAAQSESSSA